MSDRTVILQVEDREDDVYLFSRAVKRAELDVDVQVAMHGQEAIDYLAGAGKFADRQRFPLPYLILLDLKLPLRMGLEVLAWIRSQRQLRRIIVIVLSSSIDEGDLDRAYELGANAFLVKPSDINALIEMCRALQHFWMTFNQPPARKSTPIV